MKNMFYMDKVGKEKYNPVGFFTSLYFPDEKNIQRNQVSWPKQLHRSNFLWHIQLTIEIIGAGYR